MHFKKKIDEYYQVKAFYALQDNYEVLRAFKTDRALRIKYGIILALKQNRIKESARSYKVNVAH